MLKPRPLLLALLLGVLFLSQMSNAEDYYDAGDDAAAADDGAAGDDGAAAADDGAAAAGDDQYYKAKDDDDAEASYVGDDYIKYWTEYAVLPKKCITYKNVDMIVYSMYEHSSNHCTDKPVGTYMTTVPTFVSAYIDQLEANAADIGSDDYESPDTTFVSCYPYETNNGVYYAQLGCTDGDSKSLSVQLYADNTCETPDKDANGNDDLNFDASSLQIPFKECKSCVNFVDKNEDDVDDNYFENKMKNAPLCSTIWASKQTCDGRCKRLGYDASENGWNASDRVLLGVLSVFSAIMMAVILKKRTKMSNKDALLEEAALSAAGLQQTHIIGIFVLILFVVILFGLLGFKAITWGMLLIINAILFGYLMKLTIVSGLNAPDGQLMDGDSSDEEDDDDDEDEEKDGTNAATSGAQGGEYKSPEVPTLPPVT